MKKDEIKLSLLMYNIVICTENFIENATITCSKLTEYEVHMKINCIYLGITLTKYM